MRVETGLIVKILRDVADLVEQLEVAEVDCVMEASRGSREVPPLPGEMWSRIEPDGTFDYQATAWAPGFMLSLSVSNSTPSKRAPRPEEA